MIHEIMIDMINELEKLCYFQERESRISEDIPFFGPNTGVARPSSGAFSGGGVCYPKSDKRHPASGYKNFLYPQSTSALAILKLSYSLPRCLSKSLQQ
jgi:hypothetical protein